jgi:hypothetical protein
MKERVNRFLNSVRDVFSSNRADDPFVTLIQVALETPSIKQQLVALLSLPSQQRSEKLEVWITELEADGAPALLLDALAYLEDEARANQTLMILQNKT